MDELKQVGDPELRGPAARVKRINRATREALALMAEAMGASGGVGLAAPQLGLDRRLVVVDVGQGLVQLVNPELTRLEGTVTAWEGCLSIPGLTGLVTRHEKVAVRALDGRGHRVWVEGEDLLARALQHEIDHLDGVLFLDRAEAFEYAGAETAEGEERPPRRGGPPGPTPPVPVRDLRIVFMGTPAFALPTLTALSEGPYRVVGVVVQPDRPAGRGGRITPAPVKEYALSRGLPVLQPARVGESLDQLATWKPDLIITVAFGQLLPGDLLALPTRGCVNLHASLLPRHRGAAPIQHAILQGDPVTGITAFYLDEGMDTGDIILRRQIAVRPADTYGSLHDHLAVLGAGLVEETVRLIARGIVPRLAQDELGATRAPRLTAADERLGWQLPAVQLARRVRALAPRPGAYTAHDGRRLKVWQARADTGSGRPGEVVAVEPDGIRIGTGEGNLVLEIVQPEGGRSMAAAEYARGRHLNPGALL
ncbi:MAG: methionyl-tRNA formyltransferase [bacterium]|nr:methionyl-tRNA formyltransferase [bacterium]